MFPGRKWSSVAKLWVRLSYFGLACYGNQTGLCFILLFSNRRFSVNFLIQKKPKIDPESHNFLNAARKPLKPDYRIKLYFQVPTSKHLTAWLSLSEEYHKRFVCYVSSESHEAALYQILCVFF